MSLLNIIESKQCSLSTLRNFLSDFSLATNLEISLQRLSTTSDGNDEVLIGSFILFACKDGFVNRDNNLNVTCDMNGLWTAFPTCIAINTPGSNPNNNTITTTASAAIPRNCPVTDNTWNFTNGFVCNTANVQINSDGTARGNADSKIDLI